MKIGENLKKLRKAANLSQEEVARELNLTRQSVSRWETGKAIPDMENLLILKDLYGVSLDELFGVEKAKIETEIDADVSEDGEKKVHLEWNNQLLVFVAIIVSALIPPLGIFVPMVVLMKSRKSDSDKVTVLIKVLCVLCIIVSIYNCVTILNGWFHFWVHSTVEVVS